MGSSEEVAWGPGACRSGRGREGSLGLLKRPGEFNSRTTLPSARNSPSLPETARFLQKDLMFQLSQLMGYGTLPIGWERGRNEPRYVSYHPFYFMARFTTKNPLSMRFSTWPELYVGDGCQGSPDTQLPRCSVPGTREETGKGTFCPRGSWKSPLFPQTCRSGW